MAIDFPASPTEGQVFYPTTATGSGPIFVYRTGKGWTRNSGTANWFNKVVNPTMQISQQNASNTVSINGSYPVDQWVFNFAGTYNNTNSTRVSMGVSPYGSQYIVNFDSNLGP